MQFSTLGIMPPEMVPSAIRARACSTVMSWMTIAKWTPSSSRPGTGRSRGTREPIASTTASNSARSSSAVTSTPTSTPQRSSTPSLAQLLDAALDDALLDLEVRHAEAHQPAGGLVALEQRRRGGRRGAAAARRPCPAGPAPTTATLRPVSTRGGCGHDPALVPRAVDDRVLDLLDRDRVALVDLEHARGLARRRAQAAGELGEVVRRVQLADRVVPAVAVDEVVPVGDQVAERAAVVAERHAALHAARALRGAARRPGGWTRNSSSSRSTRSCGSRVGDARAVDLQEAAELTHRRLSPRRSRRAARRRACDAIVATSLRRRRLRARLRAPSSASTRL